MNWSDALSVVAVGLSSIVAWRQFRSEGRANLIVSWRDGMAVVVNQGPGIARNADAHATTTVGDGATKLEWGSVKAPRLSPGQHVPFFVISGWGQGAVNFKMTWKDNGITRRSAEVTLTPPARRPAPRPPQDILEKLVDDIADNRYWANQDL